ncbi:MAG: FtsW/RodA/SpoVE family cell cycle protein [Clostridia bacterium]|nr:FtsW/RodA/SpoVE family cell cycle protein [Clostridia bacterium]
MFNKVKGINILSKFDIVLFVLTGMLTAFGFLVLRSATATMNTGAGILRTQLFSIILGAVLCIIISFIDYEYYKILGYVFYGATLLLLIYVIPFGWGKEIEGIGSNSWIIISGFKFQPSELAKVTYMMAVPALLANLKEEFNLRDFILAVVLALLPIGLVLMQPDFGTAMVFTSGLIAVVFVYGIKYRYVLIGIGLAAVAAPLSWFFVLKPYQKERIIALLNPLNDVQGSGYQTQKARIAIGSGQLQGSGLFNGLQSQQNGAIPVKESDFIFSVIGEELGFIGSVGMILLMAAMLLWCIRIAIKARDHYGAFMVTGLLTMMAFHFIENVGMNIGIMPVTGIPLPFISAGGSAMLMNFIAVGLIMSVSARSRMT